MLEKTEGTAKNGQGSETGNIEHTRYRTKKNKTKNNPETLATFGTQDTGQRKTKQKTTQRHWQHLVHKI